MLGMCWITRSAYGGSQNVELPAYAVAAPVFLLSLYFFFENFARFVPANL